MKLYLTHESHYKIKAIYDACPTTEVCGLGKIEQVEGGFRVVDVAITKQTVTGASTEVDTDDLLDFFISRQKIGDASEWRMRWHSHVRMDVFWSGVDETGIDTVGETGDWLVSMVGNIQGHRLGRLDIFQPLRVTFPLEVAIEPPTENEALKEWASDVVSEKVAKPVPVTYGTKYTPRNGVTIPLWPYDGDIEALPDWQTKIWDKYQKKHIPLSEIAEFAVMGMELGDYDDV